MVKVSSTFVFVVGIIILLVNVYGLLWNKWWLTIYATVIGMFLLMLSTLTNIIGSEADVIDSDGRAVLITGCDTGFGFELAKKFNDVGFKVFAGCLHPEENGALELKEMSGGRIFVFHLDVTSDESVKKCLEVVSNLLKQHVLWCLINNAGIAEQSLIDFCPLSSFQRHLDINTLGPIRMCKTFMPHLRRSRGRIINIISMAGRLAPWCLGAYNTSKYGLMGFTDSLRQELAQFGIKVISIEPARFRTTIVSPDSAFELNKRYWREADDLTKAYYGEDFYKSVLKLYKKRYLLADPRLSLVVDEVLEAAVSYSPKRTYPCGKLMARWTYWWLQMCPYWLREALTAGNAPDEKVAHGIDDS